MESVAYAITMGLLALVPHIGGEHAKMYGDAVAHAARTHHVDPWTLLAIGRVESNWNADHMGTCCGGVMSIQWPGWRRYAQRHGLRDDAQTLHELARDPNRNIELAADALANLRQQCGRIARVVAGAYQTGRCAANAYGDLVTAIARNYRARYELHARRWGRNRRGNHVFAEVGFTYGAPAEVLAETEATAASGP